VSLSPEAVPAAIRKLLGRVRGEGDAAHGPPSRRRPAAAARHGMRGLAAAVARGPRLGGGDGLGLTTLQTGSYILLVSRMHYRCTANERMS
jgi:hypothetical protein